MPRTAIARSWGEHVSQTGTICVPLSFETGEQCTVRVPFSQRVQIDELKGDVTKALAGTDAGTVQLKDAAGNNVAAGLLTFAAGAALNTRQTTVPTGAGAFVGAGSFVDLVAAKTTAGGKVHCFLRWSIAP
jgi:hypothetical protein